MFRSSIVFLVLLVSIFSLDAQIDHPQVPFVKSELQKQRVETDEIHITDHYTSQGITHIYFKESLDGIRVYNSTGAIHHKGGTQIITKPNFLKYSKENRLLVPKISPEQAIRNVVRASGIDYDGEIEMSGTPVGNEKKQKVEESALSLMPIEVKLQYLVFEKHLRLVWEFAIEDPRTSWMKDYFVDAATGEILMEIDWTVACNHGDASESHSKNCKHDHNADYKREEKRSTMVPNTYEIYEWPVESPNYGNRSIVTSPWDDNLVASPNGWHVIGGNTFTTTRGNNTDTYLDDDNTNSPTGGDAARADGGADLEFIFPLDVTMDPVLYKEAALTNCFYWTNLMHDVWFNYGFDEVSGNFQEENYTPSGAGSDYVRSEVQDGSGTCNANFGTPPDGSNPRMQMYLCNGRDGDYDNGVIAHEYGHGVSNRLTGGPAASGCLGNQEQMGEGWSDYLGLVMTIEPGDTEFDARGIGTWLFGQGPNGGGIRPNPYSTDMTVNPNTYDDIKTFSVPHGVGSVWCTMLWDMTWALINEYGLDADIYNGTGGNNIAMQLVMEGMKLQACSPGFVDGRDAILEADMLINGGANQCLIWNVFARRGLGYSASQGSSGSRSDGTEAFDLPPSCSLSISKSTTSTNASEGDQIMYEILVENNYPDSNLVGLVVTDDIPNELSFISASDSGTESSGVITFPSIDLLAGESKLYMVTLEVKLGLEYSVSDLYDNMESGATNWNPTQTGSTNWSIVNTDSNSPSNSWFAPDNPTVGSANLDLALEIGLNGDSELSFFHKYDTEVSWDGGQVLLSTDSGASFIDLGPFMTANGYNNLIFNSIPGFSGNSGGFINTQIDLSSFSGQTVIIRFLMNCDQAVGGVGWWIDDFIATNLSLITVNKATVENPDHNVTTFASGVILDPPGSILKVELDIIEITCEGEDDGVVSALATGGSGVYTYLWNDGDTSPSKSNLAPGIYSVTVDDGNGRVSKVAIMNNPPLILTSYVVEDVTNVDGNNGSINLSVSGGVPGFTYLWSNGETTEDISGLTEGIYSVTITDSGGCEVITSAEVMRITCGDSTYDSGGPGSNYSNQEDITTILCPDMPDQAMVLTFNSFDIESNWDALYVHNGDDINKPLFASNNPETDAGYPAGGYYGSSIPGPFTSTDESGCITLRFRSDQFVTGSGWDIDLTCTMLCSEEVSNTEDDGWGSLRRTIECANPGESILVLNTLGADTIGLDGAIVIDKDISILIPDGSVTTIGIDGAGPIFNVELGNTLTIDNLRLISGTSATAGSIINNGSLILEDVDIIKNPTIPSPSSLIENTGTITVTGNSNIKQE